MKTVFSNSMVAHVWAQQSQPHGHSDSMSFDRDTLYSYRTPIARIIAGMNGVCLATSHTYSMTTSCKHMPQIWRALATNVVMFRVPIVTAGSKREHTENLDYLVAEYVKERERLRRAVNVYNYERLQEYAQHALGYAARFELNPPVIDWKIDAAGLKVFRAEREKRLNTPANIAKRAKLRETRIERMAAAEARKAEKARAELAQIIPNWRAGKGYSIHGLPYALLRVSANGETVQTSQGAAVPASVARTALQHIGALMRAGGWHTNGNKYQVGDFQLREVTADGRVTIGCHKFERAELAALADALGMVNGPMDAVMIYDGGRTDVPA